MNAAWCWGSLLLYATSAHAQVAVAEISGSHGTDAPFHGYVAFLDYSVKPKIEPVVIRPKSVTACGAQCKSPMAPLVTTYEFAQAVGAFLAVNGSFSDPAAKGYDVCGCLRVWGPVKSNGKLLWGATGRPDDLGNPALLFGIDGRPAIRMATADDVKRARNAISGEFPRTPGTLLVQDAVQLGATAMPAPMELAPRTAVGLTADTVGASA